MLPTSENCILGQSGELSGSRSTDPNNNNNNVIIIIINTGDALFCTTGEFVLFVCDRRRWQKTGVCHQYGSDDAGAKHSATLGLQTCTGTTPVLYYTAILQLFERYLFCRLKLVFV